MALESVLRFQPYIWFDTTGYGFSYPVIALTSCKIGCYVHYPLISTDMLQRVKEGRILYNNKAWIAKSNTLSKLKLYYYRLLAFVYGICGSFSHKTIVNGTWTSEHIKGIWKIKPKIVFPPCDVSQFKENAKLDN
eukprot:UN31296